MTDRRTIIKNAAAGFLSLFGIKAASAMATEPQEISIEPKIGQIEISFQDAIKIVREHLQNDPGLWITYQSNIAQVMNTHAGYANWKNSNKDADKIMKLLFDAPRSNGL